MGFSNSLKNNAVNEWKDYYLEYGRLRSKLRHRDFKTCLYNELSKVNNFYFLLEKKAVDEKNKIFEEAFKKEIEFEKARTETTDNEFISKPSVKEMLFQDSETEAPNDVLSNNTSEDLDETSSLTLSDKFVDFMNIKKGFRKRKKEKHLTEFLNSLVKIKAYRDLNSTGFIKLAKKYSEIHKNSKFYSKFMEKLQENYFYKSKRISSIKNATKKMYKQLFAKNQPGKARSVFRRLGRGSKSIDIYYIASGMLMGISSCLSFVIKRELFLSRSSFLLFHSLNNFLWGVILFGLCLKIFKIFFINYKFIFNFDVVSPMDNSRYLLLFSTFLFLNAVLFYCVPQITSDNAELFVCYSPIIALLSFFLCPFDVLFKNSRIYLMAVLSRAILLPISVIRFRHFYFVDFLQSFKFPIVNICKFVSANPWGSSLFFCIFPTIRILQCLKRFSSSKLVFPHILNAFKYMLVLISLLFDILYFPGDESLKANTSVILKIISLVASFLWDVVIDWAIIRNRYVFPKYFYLFAVIYNLCARSLSVFIFIQDPKNDSENDYLRIAESLCEIIRRCVWTLIRVEVEHLNNCDELKSKKSINLTAGELFYKKDHEEALHNNNLSFETETEYDEVSIVKNNFTNETSEDDSTIDDTGCESTDQEESPSIYYPDQNVNNYETEVDNVSSAHEDDAY